MHYRQLAQQLRKKPTDAERLLWQHLRLKQIENFKFRRQHPIGKYIVDFICLEADLIIELDGGQHNTNENTNADLVRTAWLESQGLKVLRFWNHEVFTKLTVVKETIWNALQNSPHPNPPPKKGEGN